jgi:DNA helicase II / ATP-dependent DNA helicase PcrA
VQTIDRLLEGLDADQREAVLSPGAPLAVIAPAGSGKTRVLTHRIARRSLDGSAEPAHVLAITFTRRAADELVRRLRALGLRDRPMAGTFHGVALQILRQRWADEGRAVPTLLPNPSSVLASLVLDAGPATRRVAPTDMATEIGWARARLVTPSTYVDAARRAGRRPSVPLEQMADVFGRYAEAKRNRRLVDFDDLLAQCTAEIGRDARFAEVQRWRFRHLFVDEFQDVNPLQLALLDALRGGRPDLCVVGDPNQAIYAWNGADPSWLRDFADHQPGATIVRLRHTYRSTPEVVRVAHEVLATGEDPGALPVPVRPSGVVPQVHAFADEHAEALGIVALLRSERGPGRRWSAYAVLVRTHGQAAIVESALRAAGIPARVRGAGTLLDDPTVRSVLHDAAVASPGPGGLRDLAEAIEAADDEVLAVARRRQVAAMAWSYLDDEPAATVESFRTWLALGGGDGEDDAVDVLTFHAAKGLEWPVVVVAGLERGLVPHASANSAAARAEEVRLLYVALTRAEHTLHCTWAKRRGRSQRTPSPLLAGIEGGRLPEAVAPPPAELVDVPLLDPPHLLDALREWRRHAARAAGLPERAICSDDALRAVARDEPVTLAELAAMPEVGPLAAGALGPRLLAVVECSRNAEPSTSC